MLQCPTYESKGNNERTIQTTLDNNLNGTDFKERNNENKTAQLTRTGKQLRAISELFGDPDIKTAYTITTLTTYSKEET